MGLSEPNIAGVLEAVARGDVEQLDTLLQLLIDALVFLPNREEDSKQVRLSVPVVTLPGRTLVPVFTTKELFSDWAGGFYGCLNLPGADIAMSIPDDTWIIVNPGSASEIELSPEEICKLVRLAHEGAGVELPPEDFIVPERPGNDDRLADIEDDAPDCNEVTRELREVLAMEPLT